MGPLQQILVLSVLIQLNSGDISSEPKDVIYQRNVDTTGYLNCQLSLPVTKSVGWVKNGDLIYISSGDSNEKYLVSNNSNVDGNFSLTIANLTREDSGTYKCQYGVPPKVTASATITVADPPGDPHITKPDSLAEEQNAKFECSSTGGYPTPQFIWSKDGIAIDATAATIETGGVSTSELEIRLDHTDDGVTIQCVMLHPLKNATVELELDVKYKPRVTVAIDGQSQSTVSRGKPFNISCEILSNPSSDNAVVWRRDGTALSTTLSTTSIHLQVPGIEDDSEYQCTAVNTVGVGHGYISLTVHYTPEVDISQGSVITRNTTQTLTLNCQADARPAVSGYKWINADGSVLGTSAELTIPSVDTSHAGDYTCEATNQFEGTLVARNSSITVIINYAPGKPAVFIDPENSDGIYRIGDGIKFTCNQSQGDEGFPAAAFKWFRSGADLGVDRQELPIDSALFKNSGEYTCQVSNMMGQESSLSRQIEIQGTPDFISSSSTEANYTSLSPNVNFTKGDRGQYLTCEFEGNPRPRVVWYQGNNPIEEDSRYNIVVETPKRKSIGRVFSKLEFKGSNQEGIEIYNMQVYSCKAWSSVGEASTKIEFTVDVLFAPQIHGHGKSAVKLGKPGELSCEVHSYPPVTSITISKNGDHLTTTSTISISDIQYSVGGLKYSQKRTISFSAVNSSDFGSYRCVAINSLGEFEQDIVLQRKGPPDAPSNLTIVKKYWDSFDLQWSPGFNGGETQRFIVTVNGVNEQAIADSVYTVKGLYPSTEHTIKVTAKNSFGESATDSVMTATNSLTLPKPDVEVNKVDKMIVVRLKSPNTTECCVLIMGSADRLEEVPLFDGKCHVVDGEKNFPMSPPYSYYKVKACVVGRENKVCGESTVTEKVVMDDNMKWVIVGVVIGIVFIIVIVAAVAVVITKHRLAKRKPSAKSISPPLTNGGQINHVMIRPSEDVEMEQPYATYTPVNNNLNTRADQNDRIDHPKHTENLDYIYAAVQKKSADTTKTLNEYNSRHHYENGAPPLCARNYELEHRFSPPPLESNSDNTEQDTLDDMPVFSDHDHNLSQIIGNSPPHYKRLSNVSESGYSTPDSRVKRVVYEVIV